MESGFTAITKKKESVSFQCHIEDECSESNCYIFREKKEGIDC